jgi:hypothetical protein
MVQRGEAWQGVLAGTSVRPRHHHLRRILLLLLAAAGLASVAGADAPAREYNLPGLPALDHYTRGEDDESKGGCTVRANDPALVDEFAARIAAWRREFGDVKAWTERTLRRHEEPSTAAETEGNTSTDDALFGAYLKKLQQLQPSASPSPSPSPSPSAGDTKAKMQYKITYVGYAEGEEFRATYKRMEAAAKEFGRADAFEFWDKVGLYRLNPADP